MLKCIQKLLCLLMIVSFVSDRSLHFYIDSHTFQVASDGSLDLSHEDSEDPNEFPVDEKICKWWNLLAEETKFLIQGDENIIVSNDYLPVNLFENSYINISVFNISPSRSPS